MAYCRKPKKNKNCRLLILVFTMILMFESCSISTLETQSSNTSCSNELTCTKCTIKAQCQWSLQKQKCTKKIFKKLSSLTASTLEECPQFSIDKQYDYYFTFFSSFIDLKYIVKVSNDLVGFMDYLRTSNIYLQRTLNFEKRYNKEITNDSIIFTLSTKVSILMVDNTPLSTTEFLFIKFNNVILRFDNVADHYVTFDIRHRKCSDDEKDKFCATCGWNYNGYSNYLKWCSNDNICGGQKHLYLKNSAKDIISVSSLLDQQNEEVYVTNDCPEVNVTAVHPLFGPRTGGTEVTITVRNHRIFVESQSIQMMVVVAGMVCTNPRTSGPETITCNTSPWVNVKGEPPTPGPILVKYSSYLGRLTIESSQRFQYDARPSCGSPSPVLDANHRLRSLESGDIAVPVRGVHFVEPCVASSARLFVVLPNGTKQFASSYCNIPVNDTYMVCRSPRVDSRVWPDNSSVKQRFLNFGLNVMNLIGNQSFFVEGPSHGFKVLIDPVLVDFNVIKSNGSVVFNGRHLNHFQSDVILIRLPNSSATGCESALDCVVVACCENVMFSRQHIICHPNVTIAPAATASRNILVMIGDRLSYTVPNRSLPPVKQSTGRPEKWRGIVSLSTCLFVVCALAFYLRTKNQYSLTETDGDLPMASTRSQSAITQ